MFYYITLRCNCFRFVYGLVMLCGQETAFATMTFFEGQVLKGEFGSLQDAKWLKNTKSFNKASARKFHSREVVVTVEKVSFPEEN